MATAGLAMPQNKSKERDTDASNDKEGDNDKDGANKEDERIEVEGA